MPDSNMVNWQEKQLVKKKVTLVRSGVPAVRFGTRRLIWWAFELRSGRQRKALQNQVFKSWFTALLVSVANPLHRLVDADEFAKVDGCFLPGPRPRR